MSLKLMTVVSILTCLVGCWYQSYVLLDEYFKYHTITKVYADINETIPPEALVLCARYLEVFNFEQYNLFEGTFVATNVSDVDSIIQTQRKLRVSDIFEFTPPANDAVENCLIRHPNTYNFEILKKEECDESIEVQKFYLMEYICYSFTLRNLSDDYKYRHITYAVNYPSVMFGFGLNMKQFRQFGDFRATVVRPNSEN